MVAQPRWGDWVQGMLDETGMTAADLAKAINVRQSTVSRWLSGLIERPGFDIVIDVGRVFDRIDDALWAARYRPEMPSDENQAEGPSQAV